MRNLNINIPQGKENLFVRAFTHSTLENEHKELPSYEMYEFLGDALLASKISMYLYQNKGVKTPEKASLAKAKITGNAHLSKVSTKLLLPNFLFKSKGAANVINKQKTKSDIFEALCAAIYLANGTQGSAELDKFLYRYLYNDLDDMLKTNKLKSPVTIFQEKIQNTYRYNAKIVYQSKFLSHDNLFICELFVCLKNGEKINFGQGSGVNKKLACLQAAKNALVANVEI